VPATHEWPEDPIGLVVLYQNAHFGHFKNTLEAQKAEFRSLEVNELAMKSKNKNVRDMYTEIREFKRDY
jgi:hypothetical protein